MQFRLTRGALEDLGLDVAAFCERAADEYRDAHDVVEAFVARRSQNPEGAETTRLPSTTGVVVFNLHVGRWRALTWHDQDDDIMWLLGAGWHESGSIDDAYAVLKRRDERGDLLPTEQDYLDILPPASPDFISRVIEQCSELMARAHERPNEEVRTFIGDVVDASAMVELVVIAAEQLREIWIAIRLPPRERDDLRLPSEWLTLVVAALLPDADPDQLRWQGPFPGHAEDLSEVVVSWSP